MFWHYPTMKPRWRAKLTSERRWKLIHYWEDGPRELYKLGWRSWKSWMTKPKPIPIVHRTFWEIWWLWLKKSGANYAKPRPALQCRSAAVVGPFVIAPQFFGSLGKEPSPMLSPTFVPNKDCGEVRRWIEFQAYWIEIFIFYPSHLRLFFLKWKTFNSVRFSLL